jgi:hypothetical protein
MFNIELHYLIRMLLTDAKFLNEVSLKEISKMKEGVTSVSEKLHTGKVETVQSLNSKVKTET